MPQRLSSPSNYSGYDLPVEGTELADSEKRPGLSARELQTLLLTGQAMAQEQDEAGICRWVTDAAASLLTAPLVSISLNPAGQNGTRAVYGNLRDSPLATAMVEDLAK